MFCPKCATQNLDGASYCRSCGANISLVPTALSGQLPLAQSEDHDFGRRGRRRGKEARMDNAFRSAFMGIAFLLVSIALSFSPMGRGWWFWMLIPAFSMMGSGVAQYIRAKEQQQRALGPGSFNQPVKPAPQHRRVRRMPPPPRRLRLHRLRLFERAPNTLATHPNAHRAALACEGSAVRSTRAPRHRGRRRDAVAVTRDTL